MKTILCTFNSDQVNLYGIRFSLGALMSALEQRWRHGTPSSIGHDLHRACGWAKPVGVYLEPGLTRLLGTVNYAETSEEQRQVAQGTRSYILSEMEKSVAADLPRLKATLGDCLTGEEKAFDASCVTMVREGLAHDACPSVFDDADSDGLVPLSRLEPVAPGVYRHGNVLLFAHPFLRRALSRLNSLNTPFLEALQRLTGTADLGVKIALDPDMVGLPGTLKEHIELEYWWGPKFDDSLRSIDEGVTHHEAADTERIMHGISRTEFWWYRQDDKKTIEIEELRDEPTLGVGMDEYGCRFAHSMLDDTGTPDHLDGAIRLYPLAKMLARLDADLKSAGRHTEYLKLWRVDGSINVGIWKELLTHYFRDNSLIGEYFGAHDPAMSDSRQALSSTERADPYGDYIPCEMPAGSGPRLAICYRQKAPEDAGPSGRFARVTERMLQGERTISYMEADAVELSKALTRMGETLVLPRDVDSLIFEDLNTTLPMVAHTGTDSVELANKTVDAIGMLIEAWRLTSFDRALVFTLEVEYPDRHVILSVLGNVTDLSEWFRLEPLRFPSQASDVTAWLESVKDYTTKTFAGTGDVPRMSDILQMDGMLCFPRRFLRPGTYERSLDGARVLIDAVLPDSRLVGSVRNGRLQCAPVYRLIRSCCSKCGGDYRQCSCSKVLESGVTQRVKEAEPLGVFWTNRKA